jgi:hypothetical protein
VVLASLFEREPSWVGLAAAQVALALWLALLLVGDLEGPGGWPPFGRATGATAAAVMGAFGFVVPSVLSMFPRLAPGLLGLGRPARRLALAAPAVGASMAAVALTWLFTGELGLVGLEGALAVAGAVLLVVALRSARRPNVLHLPVAAAAPFAPISRPANLLLLGALVYLVCGGACLALVAWLPDVVARAGLLPTIAWPLHLVTAGFIALSVFGIGTRMFGAFSGVEAPPRAVWTIAIFGLAAPAGIAAGLARGRYDEVALFAAVGLVASATFSGVVFLMWMRHRRRRRSAWYLLLAASAMLVAGEALGALFALDPALLRLAPVHGQINVLGFAGLMVFGVLFELSGGQSARPGLMPAGAWVAFVWPPALALRAVGVWWWNPWVAAIGDAALLASFAAAARSARPAPPRASSPAKNAPAGALNGGPPRVP